MNTTRETPETTEQDLAHATAQLIEPAEHKAHVYGKEKTLTALSRIEVLAILITDGVERRGGETGRGPAGSRPPLHLEFMELRDTIRNTSNAEAVRITGVARYLFDVADAVRTYADAAKRNQDEARAAARKISSWVRLIDTMGEPPVFQEIQAPCSACEKSSAISTTEDGERRIGPALILEVRTGGRSFISCRACKAAWTPDQTIDMGAWVRGVSAGQVAADIAALDQPAPVKKTRPDQEHVLYELREYCQATGHMPPIGSGTPDEQRLSQWAKDRMRNTPKSEKGITVRTAVLAFASRYPKANGEARTAHASLTEQVAA